MQPSSMRLQGKKVVITAAASGMGRAGCELFTRHGAEVAAVDSDERALEDLVSSIKVAGGRATGIVADLTDRGSTVKAMAEALGVLNGIEVLWNHAGMAGPSNIDDLDMAEYKLCADLNLNSAIIASGEAIREMRRCQRGSIVFTASTSGLVGSLFSPIYSAMKHGVVGLAKGLAVRYASEGIRVNALCPGPVATPMLYRDFLNVDERFSKEENEKRLVSSVPLGRLAQPQEIAHAALWLASDDASYVTGAVLAVDGGFTAR